MLAGYPVLPTKTGQLINLLTVGHKMVVLKLSIDRN